MNTHTHTQIHSELEEHVSCPVDMHQADCEDRLPQKKERKKERKRKKDVVFNKGEAYFGRFLSVNRPTDLP